jgi:hypothetical protein
MSFLLDAIQWQALCSVVLLIGFIVATTLLQQRASERVGTMLDHMSEPVKRTLIYAAARRYFERRTVPNLFTSAAHNVPIAFLIVVVGAGAILSYFGAALFTSPHAATPSYVLGGAFATVASTSAADLGRLQSETLFVIAMAFQAAYVWLIAQLVNRINNGDVNPVTYYFLAIRILTACLVAGIARHVIEALPVIGEAMYDKQHYPVGLAALGFVIGWNPTLWINELLVKAGDLLKSTIPSQRWPAKENLPLNMTLMMIEGMVPDKIDRLAELDVDNAQKLANENPIILWVRTPCTLDVIMDWVAQAQLVVLLEETALKKLRDNGIRDVFQYFECVSDEAGRAALQQLLQIPPAVLASHARALEASPSYQRLLQLRLAIDPLQAARIDPPPLRQAA